MGFSFAKMRLIRILSTMDELRKIKETSTDEHVRNVIELAEEDLLFAHDVMAREIVKIVENASMEIKNG